MTCVSELPSNKLQYDYVIVGGGTAGCVIASRLAESLPDKTILLIEGGPSDYKNDYVLQIKNLYDMWGGEYDYGYRSVEQPNGNSNIIHSRAKVLGGCSSHNGSISMHPFEYDCKKWVEAGAYGWNFEEFKRLIQKLRNNIQPVPLKDRNLIVDDWIKATSKALNIPALTDFNRQICTTNGLSRGGVSYLPFSLYSESGIRHSASVAYIHPIFEGREKRPNLTILLNTWTSKIQVLGDVAVAVDVTFKSGANASIRARDEIVLCAGSVDTPRLMLLSGLGPREHLESVGIAVVKDLPGVGENLMDHPEVIMTWETTKPVPPDTTSFADAAVLYRRERPDANKDDGTVPDVMMHIYTMPFDEHLAREGYEVPKNGCTFSVTPNVPRSRSRGTIRLKSANSHDHPLIDFNYYSDPEGYDEATIVHAFRTARKMAQTEPFKSWIKREVAPGPSVTSDHALSEYGRRTGTTVYHPCGTVKMGDITTDMMAVVDPKLKVRGIRKLRVADASVFPLIPSINIMLTVLAVAERAAELIVDDVNHGRAAL